MMSSSRWWWKYSCRSRPQFFFGRSGFGAVVVGQVEVGDAVVECGEHDAAHGVVWGGVAEVVPEAEGYGRQFEAAFAGMVVGHAVVSVWRWRIDGGRFEHVFSFEYAAHVVSAINIHVRLSCRNIAQYNKAHRGIRCGGRRVAHACGTWIRSGLGCRIARVGVGFRAKSEVA